MEKNTKVDEQLYFSYINGNLQALEELVKKYSDNLILFINKYVNNLIESEDVMMNTFMSVMTHKKRFNGNSTFKTYLFSIARNKSIDYVRKHKREQNVVESKEVIDLEEKLLKTDLKKQVLKSLEKLPKEYYEVLYLIYIEEMNVFEISKLLNKNKKQIYNLTNRGKAKLKEIFEKERIKHEIN